MSSEFLSRNRLSNFSNASYSSNHSNGSHGNNNRFGQTVIGHDYASNILVADLAIRSTVAFNSAISSPSTASMNEASDVDEQKEIHDKGKKVKRRVTFNLDNVQVQTIPIYSSCSSSDESSESDNSLQQEEDDDIFFPPVTTTTTAKQVEGDDTPVAVSPSSPPLSPMSHMTPMALQPSSTATISERISKKASYDALQQRKQIRRRDNSNSMLSSKPGYWYPLSPTSATRSSANGGMVRYGSPLPTLRSLEMTERLITESIQREMALNPNLRHHVAAKKNNYTQGTSTTSTTPTTTAPPKSPLVNNDAASMLITDSDSDDEEVHENSQHVIKEEAQNHHDKTGIAINDEQPNMRHSPESFSSVLIDDDDEEEEGESDTSVFTSSPEPQVKYTQDKEQVDTDFTNSVYNELAKRHNQAAIPFPECEPPKLTFPFEQNLIPISANGDVVILPPPQDNNDLVCIDCSSPATDVNDQLHTRGVFFVKVLRAENLDFPIDNDNTSVYCSIRYKTAESRSYEQKMAHTMMIDHEMRILDVDPNEQVAITIHVAATQNSKRLQNASSSWYHRMKTPSDLQRYVHQKDGSICQTLFSPSRFVAEDALDQTASLMLVNNWYRINQQATNTSSSSLLLRRTSTLMKKKPTMSTPAVVREKAVGKIYVQCLYLKIKGNYIPRDIDEAVEALNAKRFHNTDWQSGYLSQLGGNAKQRNRRFFKLTGGCLFAYSHDIDRNKKDSQLPLYKIPLSRATRLICDNFVVMEREQQQSQSANPTTLVSQLERVIMLNEDDGNQDEENDGQAEKQDRNSFQLVFDNGDKIHFDCKSLEERNKWVSVIEIIVCRLPPLPDWIMN
ncbi:uncharacterized protein ATC70_011193 [Mucor velutinosus]|uniref:PH domain-containing protein n=1 Tax=Mucor velutinosus TaxID=708070 RepID=A0AAN7DGI9_9FUNG|nr:hypothetical protein ATC70_011193 [Mucor velutinosus]